jgi:hypothetical protein
VTISILLAVTSWIWMVLIMVIYYILGILFHSLHQDPNLCYYFPLLYEVIFTFIINSLLQLVFSLTSVFIRPILSLLIVIFSIFRYILRSIYDCFMMIFVLCFAKVPMEDSSIAWKIGGPGVTRIFYNQITVEDGLKRLISFLEEKELEEWRSKTEKILHSYKNKVEKFYQKINQPFGLGINVLWANVTSVRGKTLDEKDYNTDIKSLPFCIANLRGKLSNQIEERIEKFIRNDPKSKFSDRELELFLEYAPQIIKHFIIARDAHYLWKKFDVLPANWSRLTEIILSEAMNSQYLETLEEIEKRTEIKLKNEKIGEIQDILDGKVWNPAAHQKVIERQSYKEKKKVFEYKKVNTRMWWGDLETRNLNAENDLGNAIKIMVEIEKGQEEMIQKLEEWKNMHLKGKGIQD